MTTVGITVGMARHRLDLERAYLDAVLAAGGTPVLIPASVELGAGLARLLDGVDALLLSGGGDIHPTSYGEVRRATLDRADPVRDRVERDAFGLARRRGLRVLGICRGAQLMAVATGGRLVQDLAAAGYAAHLDERHDGDHAGLRHGIQANPGSLAAALLTGVESVNSHHHQSIADPGEVLGSTAWAPDGAVEAVEGPDLLGVQWHPETAFPAEPRQLRPFTWLVHGHRDWTDDH